jgi:DNA mismatch repair protein MutS
MDAGVFVPNDTNMDEHTASVNLVTGPNMAGKSTYIRQVALLTIMSQMGSFIPCSSAEIGVMDSVYTRIGAADDLSRGQSTFMVEMVETANILNNAGSRSLVILDEIGRGTSTYDGLSLAWAIAEHLHEAGSLTLFATHYHELTKLGASLPKVKNWCVAVRESKGKIVFLHKILAGAADRSYGIYVAKLAGIPQSVIKRADNILRDLETVTGATYVKDKKSTGKDSSMANTPSSPDLFDWQSK